MTSLCVDCDMAPLNHLKIHGKLFTGDLTYREGKRWVSEVDWFIASFAAIPAISRLDIDQNLSVPSDHAPVSITIDCELLQSPKVESLLDRSLMLGAHSVASTKPSVPPGIPRKRRQVKYSDVNRDAFVEKLNADDFAPNFMTQDKDIDSVSQQLFCLA